MTMKRVRMAVLILVLALIVGAILWQTSGPAEPVFEGRTLTSWLEHHVASSSASPAYGSPGWKKADEAILAIGTNGIPNLLEMLRAKDPSPVMRRVLQWAGRHRWTRIRYRPASLRHEEAAYAFEMLGAKAARAVPG